MLTLRQWLHDPKALTIGAKRGRKMPRRARRKAGR